MKQILLAILIVQAVLCGASMSDYIGKYSISSDCSSKCPRTTVNDQSFACPKAGNSGQIILAGDQNQYYIKFDATNSWGLPTSFQAYFTTKNIDTNAFGLSTLTIPMDENYQFVIEPCYLGGLTHKSCPKSDSSILVAWKINKTQAFNECAFIMTKIDSMEFFYGEVEKYQKKQVRDFLEK